jgi:ribonuclease VapC
MIIDTSAIIAILRAEPDARRVVLAMQESQTPIRISAATYVEIGAVIDQARDPIASRRVDELLNALGIVIEAVTAQQADLAREAYRDFGKGSRHKAQLNFGDCFSYALAKSFAEPLLFKGTDFRHTDLEIVEYIKTDRS